MKKIERVQKSSNTTLFSAEHYSSWSLVNTPVDGQNLAVLSQEAGKAAYSREYGFVHASAIRSDGG